MCLQCTHICTCVHNWAYVSVGKYPKFYVCHNFEQVYTPQSILKVFLKGLSIDKRNKSIKKQRQLTKRTVCLLRLLVCFTFFPLGEWERKKRLEVEYRIDKCLCHNSQRLYYGIFQSLLWIMVTRMRDILVLSNEQIFYMSYMLTADKLPCQYCSRTSTLWFYEYTFLSICVRCISGIIVFLMYWMVCLLLCTKGINNVIFVL